MYAHVGARPSGGEAFFKSQPGKITIWWAILDLRFYRSSLRSAGADPLHCPESGEQERDAIGASFIGMFVVVDLAVTWSHYASIPPSTTATRRPLMMRIALLFLAAAEYAAAVLATPLEIVYAITILSIGVLLIGILMLKSQFGWISAYLGLITGVLRDRFVDWLVPSDHRKRALRNALVLLRRLQIDPAHEPLVRATPK